jgi:quercetin dioxygenase-like cupin family protein
VLAGDDGRCPDSLDPSRIHDQEVTVETISLTALGDQLLDTARGASSGRAATTLHGGHDHLLRQTLVALAAGHALDEHDSPPEATVQVLRGRVRLLAGAETCPAGDGEFIVIPAERHALEADADAVVLLTVRTAAR